MVTITAHTNSQSETAKEGTVNEASTNHPFTNRSQKCVKKMEIVQWTINFDQ